MYPTKKEVSFFAFTQKVLNFCEEMTKKGHTVYHYGIPGSEVNCTKSFDCVSEKTLKETYGDENIIDFRSQSINNKVHKEFNEIAGNFLKNNIKSKNEFLLPFWGIGHEKVCKDYKDKLIVIEPSVGYDSFFAKYKVFETYTHMHRMYGSYHKMFPNPYDAVIPPGFYLNEFDISDKPGDYLLFLGRICGPKGILIAQDISNKANIPIKFVGHEFTDASLGKSYLTEVLGPVKQEERKELIRNAKCLIAPSTYMEPCCWVMIEAMLSGVPVVSSDFGGFVEYNIHGLTGFRCRSYNEYVHAVLNVDKLNKGDIRNYAINNFLVKDQMNKYENYFNLILKIEDGKEFEITENCEFTARYI